MAKEGQVKAPRIDQITELWREIARLWSKMSEIEALARDLSDGLYRRKILKTKEEKPEEKDELLEYLKVIAGAPKKEEAPPL